MTRRPRPDAASAAVFGWHLAIVLLPVYLAAALGPGWITIVCWTWFGILAHGLLLLLHECIHKLAFRRVRLNEALAFWLLAPLFLTDFEAFRRRHWAHHRSLGEPDDPKVTYRENVRGWGMLRVVLETLLLVGALRKLGLQQGDRSGATPASRRRALVRIAVVQALFLGSLALTASRGRAPDWIAVALATGTAYVVVYIYGLASWTVLLHTLRGLAEHQHDDDTELRQGDAALRNFTDGFVERWVWGCYGFVDHATHHRAPAVPAYQLPAVTRELVSDEPRLSAAGTHFDVLLRLMRKPPKAAQA